MNLSFVLKRILQYAKPFLAYLVLGLLCAIISVLLSLSVPILTGHAIDHILGPQSVDFAGILPYLNLLALVTAGTAMFQWIMAYCTNKLTYQTITAIRNDLFQKLQTVPLQYLDSSPHGDLISRMVNDVDRVSDGLLQGFTQLFTGIVTILGTIGFMLSISVPIAAVVVLLTPLSLFVAAFIAKHSFRKFREQAAIVGELGGCIEEMIGGQKVIKAFGYEKESQQKFDEINSRLYDVGVKTQFYSSLTNPSTRFVNAMVYAAVGITGAIFIVHFNALTIGQLSSFLQYANQYTKPFNEISGVVTELQTAFASARRIIRVLDAESEIKDPLDAKSLVSSEGSISINHVSFSYQEGQTLIEDLNLAVQPGQRIAIVGPTGCGKTTIINLLMRFYETCSGDIFVDGNNIQKITRNSLRKQYGMVLQDTWLFHGTIRDNIAYGRPDARESDIIAAAKLAYAHGFIQQLPQGYETVISEDGENTSAGQKQLLCIARVMLMKPPMLILDEATSSIDTRTELKIQQAFQNMMEDRTCFIVAHRLSTIQNADCILVMNAGKVIETGTHDELLKKGGFYANLYNSQFTQE